MTNPPAYHIVALLTAVKSFTVEALAESENDFVETINLRVSIHKQA
jgi:hypothetical protein